MEKIIFELNNNHPFSKVEWPTGKISVTSSRFTSLNDTQSWYAVWLLCFTHCWKTRQNQEDTNTVCKNPPKCSFLKNNTVYNNSIKVSFWKISNECRVFFMRFFLILSSTVTTEDLIHMQSSLDFHLLTCPSVNWCYLSKHIETLCKTLEEGMSEIDQSDMEENLGLLHFMHWLEWTKGAFSKERPKLCVCTIYSRSFI